MSHHRGGMRGKYTRLVSGDEDGIGDGEDGTELSSSTLWESQKEPPHPRSRLFNLSTGRMYGLLAVVLAQVFAVVFIIYMMWSVKPHDAVKCDYVYDGYACEPQISHFWGQYSPFYRVRSLLAGGHVGGPRCKNTMVSGIYRHGARYPTAGRSIAYGATISRVLESVPRFSGKYEFLENYTYSLSSDYLTDFGEQEVRNAGKAFFDRYRELSKKNPPFFRTTNSMRVSHSTFEFVDGYREKRVAAGFEKKETKELYKVIVTLEAPGVNNTLSVVTCPNFSSQRGSDAQAEWLSHFGPRITARLNRDLPGANLTDSEMVYIMDLCPFETVAHEQGHVSPFCWLFSEEEWHQYDYFQSLGKYYGYGDGNDLGPSKGVGYVNEVIARLTGEPVKDETSTNSTMDSSRFTFPLNETMYIDFSHDNDMMSIFAAFGLYADTAPLSNTSIQDAAATKGFSASWTVPFAARMLVEKWECPGQEPVVRVLVNDRVIPLPFCKYKPDGTCKLSDFLEGLDFAVKGGHWDRCYS